MLNDGFAPKWSPLGIYQRLRRMIKQPGDILFGLRIGYFVWTIPNRIKRYPLPLLLDRIRMSPRPSTPDVDAGIERIIRLRKPWLGLKKLRSYNTCYVRALTHYRFLDSREHELRIHFVIEPGTSNPDGRLRGHAWITVDGKVIEESLERAVEGCIQEIFRHPQEIGNQPIKEQI